MTKKEELGSLGALMSFGYSSMELTKRLNEEIKESRFIIDGPQRDEVIQKVHEANKAISEAMSSLYQCINYWAVMSILFPEATERAKPELIKKYGLYEELKKKGINYIAREASGKLLGFELKPDKRMGHWQSLGQQTDISIIGDFFDSVSWDDEDPVSVDDLMRGDE